MTLLTLYLTTAVIFLVLDVIALKGFLRPLFEIHVGDYLLAKPRMGAAAAFYLFYIGGILWFASVPAMREGMPAMALVNGAIIGALAYGTYEFTNYATLRAWNMQQVVVDVSWGIILTATAAWGGLVVTRALTGSS